MIARDVVVSGNLFSSVKPKAVALGESNSQNILFGDNVLIDVQSDHKRVQTVGTLLEAPAAPAAPPPQRGAAHAAVQQARLPVAQLALQEGRRVALPVADRSLYIPGG